MLTYYRTDSGNIAFTTGNAPKGAASASESDYDAQVAAADAELDAAYAALVAEDAEIDKQRAASSSVRDAAIKNLVAGKPLTKEQAELVVV